MNDYPASAILDWYIEGVRPEIPVADNATAGQVLKVANTIPKTLEYGEGGGGDNTIYEMVYDENISQYVIEGLTPSLIDVSKPVAIYFESIVESQYIILFASGYISEDNVVIGLSFSMDNFTWNEEIEKFVQVTQ